VGGFGVGWGFVSSTVGPVGARRRRDQRGGGREPIVMLQAQALLAVLRDKDADARADADGGEAGPLSFGQIAAALMEHEERRWQALANMADWGSGARPRSELQQRCIAALALLGAADRAEAVAVLRHVPELADRDGERLADIASWAATLYPSASGATPRIQPDDR
jgi:hypothetical protein